MHECIYYMQNFTVCPTVQSYNGNNTGIMLVTKEDIGITVLTSSEHVSVARWPPC